MKAVTAFALILLALCTSIVGSQCLLVIPDEIKATDAWMLCDSIAKFLFVAAFYAVSEKGAIQNLLFGVLCLTLNNLFDEVLFDPCSFGYNEIIMLIIITIYTSLKVYASSRK